MRCDDVQETLPDRLDDLLEPDAAVAVDAHVQACGACREAERRAAAVRDALYRPWAVTAPSSGLAACVLHGRRGGATRLTLALLRYAAVFIAGVLVARQIGSPPWAESVPTAAPTVVAAPALPASPSDYPRRIR